MSEANIVTYLASLRSKAKELNLSTLQVEGMLTEEFKKANPGLKLEGFNSSKKAVALSHYFDAI